MVTIKGGGELLLQIILNPADPFAKGLAPGLFALLGSEFIVVNLGKT